MVGSKLPPEFDILSRVADAQEANARELFEYALAMELVKDGKAEVVERRMVNMRENVTFKTAAGAKFTLLEPDIIPQLLEQMGEMVREVMDEEKGGS